jgi:hypothetical protein
MNEASRKIIDNLFTLILDAIHIVTSNIANVASQYFNYELLQIHNSWIMHDARTKSIDALLMFILVCSGIVIDNIRNQGGQYSDHELHPFHCPWIMQDTRPPIIDTVLRLILRDRPIVTKHIASEGSQCYYYGLMLWHSPWIIQEEKLKIVDVPLPMTFRTWQSLFRFQFGYKGCQHVGYESQRPNYGPITLLTSPNIVDPLLALILGGSGIITSNITNNGGQFFSNDLLPFHCPWIMETTKPHADQTQFTHIFRYNNKIISHIAYNGGQYFNYE